MMQRTIFIVWLGMLAGSSHFALSQRLPARIGPQQIAAALSSGSMAVSPSQVMLPSAVAARSTDPSLDVLSIENMDGARWKVKLRCRENGACLPFYAIVSWPSPEISERAAYQWSGLHPSALSPQPPVEGPWLVRAGDAATLVFESTHVRIQLPVICLGNGIAGKSIRVTTTDHKKIYRAEVVAAGMLKGDF
jgi:Chaperone for flagella basal body P-ring formation